MANEDESRTELERWQLIVIVIVLALAFAGLAVTSAWLEKKTLLPTDGGVIALDFGTPRLNVSVTIPQVATYQYETITISSLIVQGSGNNTTYDPSPGPVSLELQDAGQNKIGGFGCSNCSLTKGAYATSIYLDPSFNSAATVGACPVPYVGRVLVLVHDLSTNASAQAGFDVFMSPTYSARLDQCQREAGNASTQLQIGGILGTTNAVLWIQDAIFFGLVSFMWGLAAHKKARRDEAWSWWDTLKFRTRARAPESPLNLLLDESRTWSKTVPLELRAMNETQRIRWIRTELLRHGKLLDELARSVKDRQDYVRLIRDLRSPQGLPELTFLERYAPVPDDFNGKNRAKPPPPPPPPGGAA